MKILALDVASVTGICVGSSGAIPKAWSVDLGKGRSEDARLSQALSMTHGLIVKHNPDLIVIEAAIGGKNASAFLIGLTCCVRGCAFNRGVKAVQVYPATVRKHFVGKAKTSRDFPTLKANAAKKAIKQEVAERARLMGWSIPDLDAADAAATWDWAQATYSKRYQSAPIGGLFG